MDNTINELTNNSFFIPGNNRDNKDNKPAYNFYDGKSDPNRFVGMCYVPMQEWDKVKNMTRKLLYFSLYFTDCLYIVYIYKLVGGF